MEIRYLCLYCGAENFTTDLIAQDDYCECNECRGLHDIELEDDGEIVVDYF